MSETVYRVQHPKDGRGPYRPGFSSQWSDTWGRCHPTIFEDFGFDITTKMSPNMHNGCAFRSMEKLTRWFSLRERQWLRQYGYVIVEIQADKVIAESDDQIIFARARAFNDGVIIVPWPDTPIRMDNIAIIDPLLSADNVDTST